VCEAGIADELCAFTIDFATQGQFTFVDFTPEPRSDVTFNLTVNRFRASGLDHQNPTPGPTRIGTLSVDTPGLGGGVNMTNSAAVSANLVLENFPDAAIAVPEPSLVFGLLAGSCFLTVVARRR
jgi:hypothetical protein